MSERRFAIYEQCYLPEMYTKLTLEIKDVEGKGNLYSIQQEPWDCNADEMLNMFRSLLLAAGFHPQTVNEVLGEG